MVNYGYNANSPNWKEEKKGQLADELQKLLTDMKLTKNTDIEKNMVMTHEFPQPYIELNGMYGGVRMRKLTALTDKQMDDLVMKADEIYLRIMANKKTTPKLN